MTLKGNFKVTHFLLSYMVCSHYDDKSNPTVHQLSSDIYFDGPTSHGSVGDWNSVHGIFKTAFVDFLQPHMKLKIQFIGNYANSQ